MTTPDEELRSLKYTADLLCSITIGKGHGVYKGHDFRGIPRRVKDCARIILRHYPSDWKINTKWLMEI